MRVKRRTLVTASSAVLFACAVGGVWATQLVWRPWLSLDYAARVLARYDGKGPVFWIPNAAEFWGAQIIQPLAQETNGLVDLKEPATFILLRIVLTSSDMSASDYRLLLNSKSLLARLVGYAAAVSHGVPLPDKSAREAEVRATARQPTTHNDPVVRLALRVAGETKVPGLIEALARNLGGEAPSSLAEESAYAAGRVPEAEEATRILKDAIKKPQFWARPEVAEALYLRLGSNADELVKEAIEIESDPSQRERIRRIAQAHQGNVNTHRQ